MRYGIRVAAVAAGVGLGIGGLWLTFPGHVLNRPPVNEPVSHGQVWFLVG